MLEGEAVEVADRAAGRHPQGLTVGVEPHRRIKQPLMPPEFTGYTHTKERQALSAVGGEGERELLLDQPACKLSGGGAGQASVLAAAA